MHACSHDVHRQCFVDSPSPVEYSGVGERHILHHITKIVISIDSITLTSVLLTDTIHVDNIMLIIRVRSGRSVCITWFSNNAAIPIFPTASQTFPSPIPRHTPSSSIPPDWPWSIRILESSSPCLPSWTLSAPACAPPPALLSPRATSAPPPLARPPVWSSLAAWPRSLSCRPLHPDRKSSNMRWAARPAPRRTAVPAGSVSQPSRRVVSGISCLACLRGMFFFGDFCQGFMLIRVCLLLIVPLCMSRLMPAFVRTMTPRERSRHAPTLLSVS